MKQLNPTVVDLVASAALTLLITILGPWILFGFMVLLHPAALLLPMALILFYGIDKRRPGLVLGVIAAPGLAVFAYWAHVWVVESQLQAFARPHMTTVTPAIKKVIILEGQDCDEECRKIVLTTDYHVARIAPKMRSGWIYSRGETCLDAHNIGTTLSLYASGIFDACIVRIATSDIVEGVRIDQYSTGDPRCPQGFRGVVWEASEISQTRSVLLGRWMGGFVVPNNFGMLRWMSSLSQREVRFPAPPSMSPTRYGFIKEVAGIDLNRDIGRLNAGNWQKAYALIAPHVFDANSEVAAQARAELSSVLRSAQRF